MSDLRFRNIDVDPDAPVEDWGFEGLLSAVDRGGFRDWQKVVAAFRRDPWGPVARVLEREVFEVAESSGVVGAMRTALGIARAEMQATEQQAVAAGLEELFQCSGMTRAQFADRLGTSQSRLSTYLSGKVTPSASLMVRARSIVAKSRSSSRDYAV